MKNFLLTATLGVLAASAVVSATEIRWSPADTVEHTTTIAPGKATELCGQIEPRLPVDWRYSATGPLTFNIHRHSGQEVIYATRSYLTREQDGKFSPTFSYEWCWMWTNDTTESVTVQVNQKR